MRMWMVPVNVMCDKHLIGEHGEFHKHMHNWRKKHRVDGRIEGNAMEPLSYKARHDEVVEEMLRRGMNHNSPQEQPDFSYLPQRQREYRVDVQANLELLASRCPECRKLIEGVE